jgi:putative transcriptional regulator
MSEHLINSADNERDFLVGRILIAMPSLSEGCFQESVVLICSHDDDHALGLILNKTIGDLTFDQVLEELSIDTAEKAETRPVYFGGPVETKRGAVLHSLDYRSGTTLALTPSVGMTATKEIMNTLAENRGIPRKALLCLGHAGWSAGQLEHELASNAWLEGNLSDDLLFDAPRENLWQDALQAIGVDPSMFSQEWVETRDKDAPLN